MLIQGNKILFSFKVSDLTNYLTTLPFCIGLGVGISDKICPSAATLSDHHWDHRILGDILKDHTDGVKPAL